MKHQVFLGIESNKVVLALCALNDSEGKEACQYIDKLFYHTYSGYRTSEYSAPALPKRQDLAEAVSCVLREAERYENRRIKSVFVVVPAPFSETILDIKQRLSPKRTTVIDDAVIDDLYDTFDTTTLAHIDNYTAQTATTKNRVWVDGTEIFTDPIGAEFNSLAISFTGVLIKNSFCDLIEDILHDERVKVAGYESATQCELMYCALSQVSASRIFMVNVGYSHTDVVMVYKGDALFTHILPFGIGTLIDYVALEYKVSRNAAYDLICDTSLTKNHGNDFRPIHQNSKETKRALLRHVQAVEQSYITEKLCDTLDSLIDQYNGMIERLFAAMHHVTDDFAEHPDDLPVIYLTGSETATLDGLPEFLSNDLGLSVVTAKSYSETVNADYLAAAAQNVYEFGEASAPSNGLFGLMGKLLKTS